MGKTSNSLQWDIKGLLGRVPDEQNLGENVSTMGGHSANEDFPRMVPVLRNFQGLISGALHGVFFAHHVREEQKEQKEHQQPQHQSDTLLVANFLLLYLSKATLLASA